MRYRDMLPKRYNFTSNPVAGDIDVMCMAQRFITRLASFLELVEEGEGHHERPSHTQALFLQWLSDIDVDILMSLPSPSREIEAERSEIVGPTELSELIGKASRLLDPKDSQNVRILLEKFKSFKKNFGLRRLKVWGSGGGGGQQES